MKLFFCLLLIITSGSTFASYRLDWVNYRGTIILSNGDSLTGDIRLYQVMNGSLFVRNNFLGFVDRNVDFKKSEQKVKWIKFIEISSVKIYADSVSQNPIIYKNLSHRTSLWRLLLKNDDNAIYDDMMIPNWYLGNAPRKMILVAKNKIVEMYSNVTWFIHDSQTKSLLKRFINKRYHKKIKRKDFSDVNEQLRFIIANG